MPTTTTTTTTPQQTRYNPTMPEYRRSHVPGATYFFTLTLADRSSALLTDHIEFFRKAYRGVQRKRPFQTVAICILPEHLHAIWALPPDDADFSLRWSQIKANFSRRFATATNLSVSKSSKREKGIWQRRFWEHQIRDERDLQRHVDYIHYNPVKHGLVAGVAQWPYSSFHAYVDRRWLREDWAGDDVDSVLGGERG